MTDTDTEIASLKQSLAEAEGQIRHLEQSLLDAENLLSSEIKGITLGPALEGRITEAEALALVNASRQSLLAGLRALKSQEKVHG